ncbi:hypothetical protein FB567DRAFT_451183 [Paraphoma chrysanthemicola]|uniref:Uncharacterized protein n=1 Tax=Paraphoma chrysanthemicola TaxID=798071 RepID=A0A8K0R028_9PLEO|nr:hypothetical protein FB567DRAFT_451183 [Paraphoma chrysanthemicola]
MSQDTATTIISLLNALNNKMDALKDEVNQRFDYLERRVNHVEDAIVRLAGPGVLPTHPIAPTIANSGNHANLHALRGPHGRAAPAAASGQTALQGGAASSNGFASMHQADQRDAAPPRAPIGSGDNAQFLPFAIEYIAKKAQQKPLHNRHTCTFCGAPTFSLECFRADHFRWCREHQRPILGQHRNCGRDYQGCKQVKWEHHPDWETIVRMSYVAGLGSKGVDNLDEKLFPIMYYPEKYDGSGYIASA